MNEMSKISDVVDTTDCLEAIGACKCTKNFLFVVVVICLLLLQGVFWLKVTGNIDMGEEAVTAMVTAAVKADVLDELPDTTLVAVKADVLDELPDTTLVAVKADVLDELPDTTLVAVKIAEDTQASEAVEKVARQENEAGEETVEDVTGEPAVRVSKVSKYVIPKYAHAVGIIRVCNFVLVVTATLYCLVLLVSLKVSLIGRLGGISHISRAFFLSLFALAVLLPWQSLFSGFAVGAIYSPDELFSGWDLWGDTLVRKIFYYLRFSGLWLLALLLLMMAQCRCGKWSRTTLKRLGVIR